MLLRVHLVRRGAAAHPPVVLRLRRARRRRRPARQREGRSRRQGPQGCLNLHFAICNDVMLEMMQSNYNLGRIISHDDMYDFLTYSTSHLAETTATMQANW